MIKNSYLAGVLLGWLGGVGYFFNKTINIKTF
jgi:hypothetical protein